ncbi:MAG TPA: indole-3-glycerol-phosphate synthase [Gemmatimonadaceae bacterium]|nr:indole-3-glycerol-phosphate synthase [Gemmatimonadaceae bacterium]
MERARERAAGLRSAEREWAARAADAGPVPSFRAALAGRATVAVIAEVKRRSPSKGDIRPSIGCADQAAAYAAGGAAALSILTEPTAFGGSDADLSAAATATSLPLLKKDFHVEPVQVLHARALGASALLLIARALSPEQLEVMTAAAREARIEALVEVRDEEELARALAAGATIVGVNNRDLETLRMERDTAERIVPMIPPQVVAIAESGVEGATDVERAGRFGADAVLVGSSVSAAADPAAAVRALTGHPRSNRGDGRGR